MARTYRGLTRLAGAFANVGPATALGACLIGAWKAGYAPRHAELVALETYGFHYLFDLTAERLLGAWGVSRGPIRRARDAARMRGHPMSAGAGYHRGHAVAHHLGGGLDINLTPQRASVNIGRFRILERAAAAHPGALYFTHWIYARPRGVIAARVEQGVLFPDGRLRLAAHGN
ncbi:MAG: hypothetical protein JNJ73_19680 [Hyphomonadaceae bacterium]|nr:hypothetical protein [Hyphomonadaceae bacterium]